jgi:uncharacterized protein YjbJ (UPF0337 family)
MNKDQIKGRAKQRDGKAKEVVGKALGNQKLETKGKIEQVSGKAQAGYGDIKHDLKKGNRK